jgi:hypothetical protein
VPDSVTFSPVRPRGGCPWPTPITSRG